MTRDEMLQLIPGQYVEVFLGSSVGWVKGVVGIHPEGVLQGDALKREWARQYREERPPSQFNCDRTSVWVIVGPVTDLRGMSFGATCFYRSEEVRLPDGAIKMSMIADLRSTER